MAGVCCWKNSFTRSSPLRWTRIQASKMCGGTLGMGPVCGAELERGFLARLAASRRSGLSSTSAAGRLRPGGVRGLGVGSSAGTGAGLRGNCKGHGTGGEDEEWLEAAGSGVGC